MTEITNAAPSEYHQSSTLGYHWEETATIASRVERNFFREGIFYAYPIITFTDNSLVTKDMWQTTYNKIPSSQHLYWGTPFSSRGQFF